MSNVTNVDYMFYGCGSLKNVIGEFSGIKISIRISSSNLTRESCLVFINGLYDFRGNGQETVNTIYFPSASKARLTSEDIAIVSNKGWTLT